jgi:hypothetical protein
MVQDISLNETWVLATFVRGFGGLEKATRIDSH